MLELKERNVSFTDAVQLLDQSLPEVHITKHFGYVSQQIFYIVKAILSWGFCYLILKAISARKKSKYSLSNLQFTVVILCSISIYLKGICFPQIKGHTTQNERNE